MKDVIHFWVLRYVELIRDAHGTLWNIIKLG